MFASLADAAIATIMTHFRHWPAENVPAPAKLFVFTG